MAVCEAKAVSAQIRRGELQNVYYFYGADLVQVASLTEQLIRKATNDQMETALTKMDGRKLDLRQLEDAAQMFSMFSPYNCILINDFNAESLREEHFKQLMEMLKAVSGVTVIVFNITGFDVKDGKKTVSGKNKKLIDWIAKNGTVCEAVPASLSEMVKQLCKQAEKAGGILPPECAEEVINRCIGNTLMMQSELQKLCACANGGTITMVQVQQLVMPALSATTFALASAVVQRRAGAAMQELERLFAMRIARPMMLSALTSSFLDLYRAAAAIRRNATQAEMKQDFGYRYDFLVKNAFRDCRRIPVERIRECINVLRDLEKTCNSAAVVEQVAIEAAIVRMLT